MRLAAVLVLFLTPLALHLPELTGWLTTNPIYYKSQFLGSGSGEGLLPGYPWLDPNVGSTTWSLGRLAAALWMHGTMPWWNHYSGAGLPLAAEGQTQALFLPFALLFQANCGLLYIKILLQIIAGLGCLGFLRQVGITRGVAVAGAALFEMNGTFATMSDQPIMPIAFLPLLLLGVEHARRHAERDIAGGWRWIAGALALSLYAGFPETAYLDGIFVAAWCIGRLAGLDRVHRWRFILHVMAGLCIGLLLAMPMLVPFLELVALSALRDPTAMFRATGSLNSLSLMLPAATMPYLFGPPAYRNAFLLHGAWAGYVTLPTLMIAVFGLLTPGRWGVRITLAVFAAVSAARMAGVPGVSELIDLLPFMPKVLLARYIWPALELAAIVSICLYLDDVRRNGQLGVLRHRAGVGAVIGLAALGVWKAAPLIGQLYHAGHGYAWFAGLSLTWAALSCMVLGVLARPRMAHRASAIAGVLIVDAATFSFLPVLSAIRPHFVDLSGVKFLVDHLGYHRYVTIGPMPANYGAAFGLASLNFNAQPVPANWIAAGGGDISRNIDDKSGDSGKASWLQSYGTKYVIVTPGAALSVSTSTGSAAPKVFSSPTMDIYELPAPAPYVQSLGAPCAITMLDRDQMNIVCAGRTTLWRLELAYPGWQANIDGQMAPVSPCGIYQCLAVPAGGTRIRFNFVPSHIGMASAAFFVGLGLLVYGAGPRHRRLTRHRDGP